MESKLTQLIGTHMDLVVGEVYQNKYITAWKDSFWVSFRVIRETTEDEYRKQFNYYGKLPGSRSNTKPRFFEIEALD